MTQIPRYGESNEGEGDRAWPPQQPYSQYPPSGSYGSAENQGYQSPPPQQQWHSGPPQGQAGDYYGQHQQPPPSNYYNQETQSGYQQPYQQQEQQWNQGYPTQQYSQQAPPPHEMASWGSPPPPQHQQSYNQGPPPAPSYGSDRRDNHSPYPPQNQAYPLAYPSSNEPGHFGAEAPPYPPPGHNPNLPPGAEQDRGLLGAVGGAAAGGFAGHKMGHHGFIGALGGAYAGHKLEDHLKDEKKKKKAEAKAQRIAMGRRGSSSSSSSSSDDDGKKKKNKKQGQAFRGNFSGSCREISLDRDYDLIASCSDTHSGHRLSSISLNELLTNDNGQFRWVGRGGNFGASAQNARLEDGGRVLTAELRNIDGHWKRSAIYLDEHVGNNDGELVFVG